ncbi:hypothetical protein D6745_04345 [Candidatus Woesearchaeota archaeon]|nr:MAG: hypothetical protein D6745_04345 [Candidatus Woesearchaeota archaeon]
MKKRGELSFFLFIIFTAFISSIYSDFGISPRYEKYASLEEIERNSKWETVEVTINDYSQILNLPVKRSARLSRLLDRVIYTYKEARLYGLPENTSYYDLQRYKADKLINLPGKSHSIQVMYVVG